MQSLNANQRPSVLGALFIPSLGQVAHVIPENKKAFTQKEIQKIMGGEVDVVPLDEHYVMIVPREVHKLAIQNKVATEKYKQAGGDKPILGDVLISDKVLLD